LRSEIIKIKLAEVGFDHNSQKYLNSLRALCEKLCAFSAVKKINRKGYAKMYFNETENDLR